LKIQRSAASDGLFNLGAQWPLTLPRSFSLSLPGRSGGALNAACYFFEPEEPLPGFTFGGGVKKDEVTGVFGFSAFGFFASRLLRCWPLAMVLS